MSQPHPCPVRVATAYKWAAAPTMKLLQDTINKVAPYSVEEQSYTGMKAYTVWKLDFRKVEQVLKRWFAHANGEVPHANVKVTDFTHSLDYGMLTQFSGLATVKDEVSAGSTQAPWISWEGREVLKIEFTKDPTSKGTPTWDAAITDKQGRVVFTGSSTPRATPGQVTIALLMDQPRFVDSKRWDEATHMREERVRDWASD